MGRTQVSVFLFMSVRAWQVEPQLVVLPAGHTHTHKSAHISPLTRTSIHTEAKSHGRLTDFPVKPCWFFSLVTLRFAGLLFVSFACHAVERVLSYRCALRMQLSVCVCVCGDLHILVCMHVVCMQCPCANFPHFVVDAFVFVVACRWSFIVSLSSSSSSCQRILAPFVCARLLFLISLAAAPVVWLVFSAFPFFNKFWNLENQFW